MNRILVIVLICLFAFSCGGKKEFGSPKAGNAFQAVAEESVSEYQDSGAGGLASKEKSADRSVKIEKKDSPLSFIFVTNFDQAKGRYLEYNIYVSYKTQILSASRLQLLNLTSKYGFLNSSSANREYLDTQVSIKIENIYSFLKEVDAIGSLESESITVTDHTGNLVWSQRKASRELIRITRKNNAFNQINAGKKNWADVEASLERSEDTMDESDQQQWNIKDNVSWAKVNIHVDGPEHGKAIRIPNYTNALVALVNMLFGFAYALIIISPVLVIAGLIWFNRKRILGIFKKK